MATKEESEAKGVLDLIQRKDIDLVKAYARPRPARKSSIKSFGKGLSNSAIPRCLPNSVVKMILGGLEELTSEWRSERSSTLKRTASG